jgi:hypothetical protein
MRACPSNQIIVQSLLASLRALLNVALLALFVFLLFGIVGIHLWSGVMRGECGHVGSDVRCALPCHDSLCKPAYGDSCPAGYVGVVSCRDVPLSSRLVSSRLVSCRVCRVCHVVSCRVVSCRVVSCRVVSCRVVSCRVVSCRVVSCRVAWL